MSSREGEQLAQKYNLKYFAASAKTGENVEEIFVYLCRTVAAELA